MLRKIEVGVHVRTCKIRALRKMITHMHLLFMDDMKIYAVLVSNLTKMLKKVADMFHTIELELGEEKCAVRQFKHGRKVERSGSVHLALM